MNFVNSKYRLYEQSFVHFNRQKLVKITLRHTFSGFSKLKKHKKHGIQTPDHHKSIKVKIN